MLRPVQPYVEYMLNQDYIAEFLCINKDKPKLQCHGKCHLAKQLSKQNENENSNTLTISLENYPIGFVYILSLIKKQSWHSKKEDNFPNSKSYYFQSTTKAFHPPDLV